MRLVLCCDRNFAMQAGVALYSALANGAGPDVLLLSSGLDPADAERFDVMARSFGARLERREVDERLFDGLPRSGRISRATYYRLLLPELLDAPKVLYLDADLAVDGDLSPLWETDLGDVALAAVPDPGAQGDRHPALGLSPTHEYFNAGVLLIDLDAWRRERVAERALEFLRREGRRALFHDQDALNVCLQDRVRPLSCNWNFMPYLRGTRFQEDFPAIEFGELKPRIIHFAGAVKPWAVDAPDDPYVSLWREYRRRSPWAWKKP